MILPLQALQEHVLSYSIYLCIAGIFSICMLTYIYLLYICSSLLIGGTKKELYALQKMISLLLLIHGNIRVHTVTSMATL